MKNFNYLSFNSQWEQLQDKKSHEQRLRSTKGSQYINKIQMQTLDKICSFKLHFRKRSHTLKNKQIQQENQLLHKRLESIKNSEIKQSQRSYSLSTAKKQLHQYLQDQEMMRQNAKLKLRLQQVGSQFDRREQNTDYEKHLRVLEKMQRFRQNNDKIVLKSLERVQSSERQRKQQIIKYPTLPMKKANYSDNNLFSDASLIEYNKKIQLQTEPQSRNTKSQNCRDYRQLKIYKNSQLSTQYAEGL